MIYTIPLNTAQDRGAFYFTVALDGQLFRLDLLFNSREGFWYMDISDQNGDPVRMGVKLVVNWPLIGPRVGTNRPLGELMVIDTRGDIEDPTWDSLGHDHQLVYIDGESYV